MEYKTVQEILQKMGRFANRNLGQNFLVNQIYASMIIDILNPKEEDSVLEIGAGIGGLSEILSLTQSSITLNECDRDFIAYLKSAFPNCQLLEGDILEQDVSSYNKIVGNLPYYITTPIIKKILSEANRLETFVFMVQKEVGQKLLAKENNKDYGPLHILLNYLGNLKYEKEIKPHNFYPRPHVDSAVLSLNLHSNIDHAFKTFFFKNLSPLFAYNRKTLRNNLKTHRYHKELTEIFESVGITLESRPQQIDSATYIDIFTKLYKKVTI